MMAMRSVLTSRNTLQYLSISRIFRLATLQQIQQKPFATKSSMQGGTLPLINEEDFASMRTSMEKYDEKRELVIKRCRDIQKLSKQAIFSLHRGATQEAAERLDTAEGIAAELLPVISENATLRSGSFAAAMEEYAEAVIFRGYLQEGRLLTSSEIPLKVLQDEYLGGVLDFAGELNRYAISRATVRDSAAVAQCRDLADALMGQFLQFDLRNGALRKKYDGLKYTLKKLENTLYELSLMQGPLKIDRDGVEVNEWSGSADEAFEEKEL